MKKILFPILAIGSILTGCHNSDIDFPDFDYQTIYFARQSPIRTITLGEERFADNDIDNEHAVEIYAALGGVNENRKNHDVKFVIDNSLCDRIVFSDGSAIKALPQEYYNVYTDHITIRKGEVLGGFRVELTDAFFNDPAAVELNYVLPVRLTESADSILSGQAKPEFGENADRLNGDHWSVKPQDYVLYALKYKNAYHGCWLSKGTDKIVNDDVATTNNRQAEMWEKASLRYLTTKSINKAVYTYTHAVATIDADGKASEKNITCELILAIDDNGDVTVSTETPNCTATGVGKWTAKGEKKAFGDEDRDRLELKYTYTIDYVVNDQAGTHATYKAEIDEVMCLRDRQNKLEEFSFKMK
ncbi:MAG: DUF1735 domain-containing protein [Muribaculaceae bacterium]|nr:DUF1735 domain-containing protein [Muribaculaceae bacterium]